MTFHYQLCYHATSKTEVRKCTQKCDYKPHKASTVNCVLECLPKNFADKDYLKVHKIKAETQQGYEHCINKCLCTDFTCIASCMSSYYDLIATYTPKSPQDIYQFCYHAQHAKTVDRCSKKCGYSGSENYNSSAVDCVIKCLPDDFPDSDYLTAHQIENVVDVQDAQKTYTHCINKGACTDSEIIIECMGQQGYSTKVYYEPTASYSNEDEDY